MVARILAIDPGTITCGWAVLTSLGERVASGRWVLDDGEWREETASRAGSRKARAPLGLRLLRLRAALVRAIADHTPALIAVETPFDRGHLAVLYLGAVYGEVCRAAWQHLGAEPLEANASRVRAFAGIPNRKAEVPGRVLELLRHQPEDHDEADALLLAWWACGQIETEDAAAG